MYPITEDKVNRITSAEAPGSHSVRGLCWPENGRIRQHLSGLSCLPEWDPRNRGSGGRATGHEGNGKGEHCARNRKFAGAPPGRAKWRQFTRTAELCERDARRLNILSASTVFVVTRTAYRTNFINSRWSIGWSRGGVGRTKRASSAYLVTVVRGRGYLGPRGFRRSYIFDEVNRGI